MKEINSYVIEDFLSKVYAAQKTNQKSVILDIKEAQNIAQNLSIILARALGQMDRASESSSTQDSQITIKMDGGSF